MAESSDVCHAAHNSLQRRSIPFAAMRLSNRLGSTATLAKRARLGALVLSHQLMRSALAANDAAISIDTSRLGPSINPQLYGIFLEEINHGVDGGLYAELIRNRG